MDVGDRVVCGRFGWEIGCLYEVELSYFAGPDSHIFFQSAKGREWLVERNRMMFGGIGLYFGIIGGWVQAREFSSRLGYWGRIWRHLN